MKKGKKIEAGDTVEYTCISGVIHPRVLRVKPDGKLILNTREEQKLIKSTSKVRKTGSLISLSKNVCVLPTRVKKL